MKTPKSSNFEERKNVHFSSQRLDWKTPRAVYQILDAEFNFDYDPCPSRYKVDGLTSSWGGRIMLIHLMVENYRNGLLKGIKSGRKARLWCS